MTLGLPAFLWGALALLPLAAVYLIRVRPRRRAVNTYFLWQHVFHQNATSSLFQRLRNWLSLLLLVIAFLAAVLALTRPQLGDTATPDLLIVIDHSASMSGLEPSGKSRLTLATDTAASWVGALSGSQRAAVASVATRLEYHANLTNRSRQLREALLAIPPTDLPLDPQALSELSLLASASGANIGDTTRIIFLTDGRSTPIDLPAHIEVITIGTPAPNIGITAADLQWDGPGRATLFASLTSTFPEDREVEMELVHPETGQLARLFSIQVPAHSQAAESIPLEGIDPGPWLLRATTGDTLAIDDEAPLGLNPPHAIPVQVMAENPFFFDQVVAAFSRADSLFAPTTDNARLALAHESSPATPTAIIFAPTGPSPFWETPGEEIPPGPPEILAPEHPLVARLDPTLLTFDGARKITAPAGAVVVLAHADGTPLIHTITTGGQSAIVFNLNPFRADFVLSPWFPVLVHDAAALLTGRGAPFPSAVATGTRIEIPGTSTNATATFRHRGTPTPTPIAFTSPLPIDRLGSYHITRDGTPWHLGAAPFSPGESGPPPENPSTPTFTPASGWPLAAWLLLAAILISLTEESLYHRRKVG